DLQSRSWQFWVMISLVFVVSTLLAGFYPAFVLSSFQPLQSLKSVAGFAAAIILIGGAIGFYFQLRYMSTRSLGINIDQTLVLQQTLGLDSSRINSVESVINNLQKIPGVEYVTASTDVPGNEVGSSSSFRMITSNDDKRCRTFGIDENF